MTKKQKLAVELLTEWGYRAIPVGRHYVAGYLRVAADEGIFHGWCAEGIIAHHESGMVTPATTCAKHAPA